MASELEWQECFAAYGAIWNYHSGGPHVVYSLGHKHSDFYFNSDIITQDHNLLQKVCREVFQPQLEELDITPDWILSYAPYGTPVALCLAEMIGVSVASTKSADDPTLDYKLGQGERVLLAADDIYSGNSLRTLLKANHESIIEDSICVIGNFSGSDYFEGRKIISAIKKNINLWSTDDCPLCKEGSVPLSARVNWQQLISDTEPCPQTLPPLP